MKKNCRFPVPAAGAAFRAALIDATDIDELKIVTFAPNGLAGVLVTAAGADVHGSLSVAAVAVAAPPICMIAAVSVAASIASIARDRRALSTRVGCNNILVLSVGMPAYPASSLSWLALLHAVAPDLFKTTCALVLQCLCGGNV
jgi:hypothetical protein